MAGIKSLPNLPVAVIVSPAASPKVTVPLKTVSPETSTLALISRLPTNVDIPAKFDVEFTTSAPPIVVIPAIETPPCS